MRGVDVSIFNEAVDWAALKAAGIDFAICRTGYGKSGFDENFQRNVDEAHKAGLICGAYHYSYALTPSDAAAEAAFCKGIIERAGVMLELPVWFSMTDADEYKARHGFEFTRSHVTNICKAFIDNIAPLNCGVYSNLSWLEDYIDWQTLGCRIWSAQYNTEDNFKGYMWQYTDALQIGGQTFNGNILYDKDAQPQIVQGVEAPVEPAAPASPQSVIQNILANARENANNTATPAATPTPSTPVKPTAAPSQSAIQSILNSARENAGAKKTAAPESPEDKIKNILAGVKKGK
ncbi:MAG: hypothetical protein IKZ53_02530 [Selenomonadaceae bacterium]|nr:hypothetical protein [Selenomonadaceae bacterium]